MSMRQTTIKHVAESPDEIVDLYLECKTAADTDFCEYDNDGNVADENVDKWLEAQKRDIEEFESDHPEFEAVTADGNSVLYRGTAQQWIDAGFDVVIENN